MSERARASAPSVSSGRQGRVRTSEPADGSGPAGPRRVSRAVRSPAARSSASPSAAGRATPSAGARPTFLSAWLHPLRRWWTSRRVRALLPVRSVLFVCHGNLCRSPYAARAFRERLTPELSDRIRVESAGFVGQGRRSPQRAVAAADERGVGLRRHASRLIEAGVVRASDLVVVMEPGQRRAMLRRFGTTRALVLADLDPEGGQGRVIRDPMWKSRETFAEVYARIDRCVERLADLVSGATA